MPLFRAARNPSLVPLHHLQASSLSAWFKLANAHRCRCAGGCDASVLLHSCRPPCPPRNLHHPGKRLQRQPGVWHAPRQPLCHHSLLCHQDPVAGTGQPPPPAWAMAALPHRASPSVCVHRCIAWRLRTPLYRLAIACIVASPSDCVQGQPQYLQRTKTVPFSQPGADTCHPVAKSCSNERRLDSRP